MKKKIKVAAVQMDVQLFNMNANLKQIESSVSEARENGADLVVFPELASIGYIRERDKEFGREYLLHAEKIPGKFTNALCGIAKQYGVYLICGMAELHPVIPGTLYNTAVLVDPSGKIVGIHRKNHIPGYEKHYFIPASTTDVFQTNIGTIGIGICYDNQFPELLRTYALQGAEILVMLWNMPTFSNRPEILKMLTATRAFENRMFAVSCNRIGTGNGITFLGYSSIADPLGNFVSEAQDDEVILYAELDRDILLTERAQMPVFRDRRPDLYGELVKTL